MKSDFVPEELTLLDPSPASSHYAETFVYAPANAQEKPLGNLYIVASVYSAKSKKENAQFVSEIATIIKNEYYKNTITTPLSAFRLALKKANNFLSEPKIAAISSAGKKTKVKIKPTDFLKIKIAAAVLKQNTLHIARLGDVAALILRNNILQPVLAETKSSAAKIQQPLAFENITSGEILPDDRIIFATNLVYKISESDLVAGLAAENLTQKITGGDKMPGAVSGLAGLCLIALRPKSPASGNQPHGQSLGPLISHSDRKATLASARLTRDPNESPAETPEEKEIRKYNEESELEQMTKTKNTRKIIIILAVALIAINTVAFVSFKLKRETAIARKEAETLVKEITDLKDKIAPLAAIDNEKEAAELLNEAQTKLKRLEELGYFNTSRATLSEELSKLAKSLQHLEPVESVRVVVDLENNSANFDPSAVSLGKNKIIVYNPTTIYKYDLNRGQGSFDVLGDKYNVSALAEDPNDPNNVIILSDNKIISRSETGDKELWQKPKNEPNLVKFSEYNNVLYLLAENGIIYKLALPAPVAATSTPEIGSGTPATPRTATQTALVFSLWLDAATKIEPPVFDLAVEGSIFTVNKDNVVFELLNGKKKAETKLFEPISQIFTLSSQKNVYLLSPDEGLVVVMEKSGAGRTGTIKKRLSHPELRGAKSFFVNSQERIAYFLKGKKVYSFEI